MSVVAPPKPPRRDELEALIREARARQRRRWVGIAIAVAVLGGAGLGTRAIVSGSSGAEHNGERVAPSATKTGRACGVRVAWTKILAPDGRVLYREPVERTMGHELRCRGASIWVIFYNGVGGSQEGYFGVHSRDGGRTWQPVFTERYFGLKAPHQLDAYMGPWTLAGRTAYFTGLCPACGRQPTVSLWVTSDGGRTFRHYEIAGLEGYWPKTIRVSGADATISADRGGEKKTATIRVA
jgi:hypothetical protein